MIEIAKNSFENESLALSSVLDESAIIISDFRLYQDGHSHIAIFPPRSTRSTGAQRAGRIVQRLLEIESYRTIALLALPSARQLNSDLSAAERKLTELVSHIKTEKYSTDKTLEE